MVNIIQYIFTGIAVNIAAIVRKGQGRNYWLVMISIIIRGLQYMVYRDNNGRSIQV